ncbi:MAG: lactate utilization protein [Chloroflexi bacterium]|nr:lactate utilization protein [Chloroflexota bacterium]
MSDDRHQVLSNIRASLQRAHLPDARANVPARAIAGQGTPEEMIASFERELEPLGATSRRAHNDTEAIELVLKWLGESGGNEVLTWGDADLPVRGLGEALRAAGYTRLEVQVPPDDAGRKAKLAELERATAGITSAYGALADSGSLVLLAGPTRSRLASLLPPTHIALLPASRLYADMAALFAAHPDLTRDASNLVFVTGPSRTADIELTLTRGVHGPKYLHVLVLE